MRHDWCAIVCMCVLVCVHIPLRIGNVHERCIVQVCHSFTINHLSSVEFYLTDQCDVLISVVIMHSSVICSSLDLELCNFVKCSLILIGNL